MNALKTTILLALLTGLLLAIGYFIGGQTGILFALGFSILLNFGSYWFSDKIVLSMYGGREIKEIDDPRLHRMTRELAHAAGLPMPRLYKIDLPSPNAFATGRNPEHAVAAVTAGLLELLDEPELRGVIAHELAHIKNRDILISSLAATLAGAISYIAQIAYFGGSMFGFGDDDDGGNIAGALVLLILSPIMATLLHLAVSRSREYLADRAGAQYCREPRALASALRKLHGYSQAHKLAAEPKHEATAHMFIVNPFKPGFLMSLFSTHPPVAERVRRLEEMA